MALSLFSPTNMTSNNVPAPFVASASSGGNFIYRGFDGSLFQATNVLTGGDCWFQLYIGTTARICAQYKITGSLGSPMESPKDWKLQGSNDGSNFTDIDTVTGQVGWGINEERIFTPDVITTAYKYFRFRSSANNGESATQITEFKYYYDSRTRYPLVTFKG